MKIKKGTIMATVMTIAVAVGAVVITTGGSAASPVGYTVIEPSDLINSVSMKGTVESVEKRNVYSTLGFPVKTINVDVGDKVSVGQVLCELDTADLELDIAQKKASLDASQQSNLNQFINNERKYSEAASNLNSGANSQVVSAETSLQTAEINLENAQRDYENALRDYQNNTDSQVTSAESNLESARLDLETKRTAYESNKVLCEVGAVSKDELTSSENAYISAQNKHNDAEMSLENAKTSQNRTLEQLESALKSAQTNYDNAETARNSAVINAEQDLGNYQSNVESAKISLNNDADLISLQKLQKQLEDSVIKAPISGTVTAAYAKEGASGSGMLFVIEDTDNLKVKTTIKEYDVGSVKPGLPVVIKTDATGSEAYEGIVSKIEPAAVKNSGGETSTTDDIEFGAEIDVTSKDTGLKVGITARLTIIMDKKEGVYCVPYDAVTTDENGNSVVFIAETNGQNSYTAKKAIVTTGMETDFYTEILGEALTEGMKIINDASAIKDGAQIVLNREG